MAAKKEAPKPQPKVDKLHRRTDSIDLPTRKKQASTPSSREADESTRGAKPADPGSGDKTK